MTSIAFGALLNLMCLAVIGAGPALYLVPSRRQFESALFVAPVIGFALTSIVGTYLVAVDKPVSTWAEKWFAAGAILSCALAAFALVIKRKQSTYAPDKDNRFMLLYLSSLSAMAVILLLPVLLGGTNFTAMRGEARDALNYIALAGYLDRMPYSWIFSASPDQIMDFHPAYALVRHLISVRWTTSAIAAWSARIAGQSPAAFEYAFTLLPLMISFGPSFLICRNLGMRPLYVLLTAMAVCVGFWPQLVLDIRAESHLCSIPLILLWALAIIWNEGENGADRLKTLFLLSIVSLALMFQYIEILPLAVFALFIFMGLQVLHRSFRTGSILLYFSSVAIASVLASGAGTWLFDFFFNQLHSAASSPNDWYLAYFRWLYSNPIRGIWGFSTLSAIPPKFLNLAGLLLSGLLACSIVYAVHFREEQGVSFSLIVSFVLASFAEFLFLYLRCQWYASAKAISYGYPFIIMAAASFVLGTPFQRVKGFFKTKSLLKALVCSWLIIQAGLGLVRVKIAYTGVEYPNYIVSHGEYRNHDYDVRSILATLKQDSRKPIAVAVYGPDVSEYLQYVLGLDLNVINIEGCYDKERRLIERKSLSELPEYLLVSRKSWPCIDDIKKYTVAFNHELCLLKVPREFWSKPVLLALENPNGLEYDADKLFIWVGGERTQLRIYAPQAGAAVLKARFTMGPSLPDKDIRTVELSVSSGQSMLLRVTESTKEIIIPLVQGINDIALKAVDKASIPVLPSGDARPLLLGLREIEFYGR